MEKQELLHLFLTPSWEIVENIHNEISKMIKELNLTDSAGEALVMAATELVENAVKYGNSLAVCEKIELNTILVDNKQIRISVRNGIMGEHDLENIRKIIIQIRQTNNLEILYKNKLTELLENPDLKRAQLGLYRLAYEGGMQLDYEYADNIIQVTATKSLTG
jgi:anti-sigma regulatory factor (Ser/Thr protein kinase)